ncbi:ATP phosphoribosyltransferase regulatory subunit [Metalysinibacillus saudimassiliensis]|uniref:ATP phosphoribosyltransferase regulatory subunit n=1 Tax=Metalysinibacillus saudimassiliensis TaxID=1461583 RepID=A0A078MFY3_9BACL|nr:ATP phosphoribosyltransferase regulatory subunit [Metalysinibacillus saudimassiliensis]
MSSIKMFEKPVGMRDTLPKIYDKTAALRQQTREFLRVRGYDFIKTPSVEYYDTIGKASAIQDASLFKLFDNQGNTLVLRPEMTTPIVRAASSKLLKEQTPLRLGYFSNVFRAQEVEGGRPAEFEQMGIELIGDETVYADAEVVATAIELLQELQVNDFKVTIGHAGILQCVLRDYTESQSEADELRNLLVKRNYVGFEEAVYAFDLPKAKSDALMQFIGEATNIEKIEDIEKYVRKNEALQYMQKLDQLLTAAGLGAYIDFDFTLSSHMNYYTGMLFEVFASGSGFALGNGGRYDGLLTEFDVQTGATGFGLRVDRLLEVLPLPVVAQERVLVTFTDDTFGAALQLARELRAQGTSVTLSAVATKVSEDNFTRIVQATKGAMTNE